MLVSNINNTFFIQNKRAWLYKKRYDGLRLVAKIRQAIRKGEKIESIVSVIRTDFYSQVQVYLNEEAIWILPVLYKENQMRKWVELQHAELVKKATIDSVKTQIRDSLPEEFADMLEENIRFEIRTLFPVIEKTLNKSELLIHT